MGEERMAEPAKVQPPPPPPPPDKCVQRFTAGLLSNSDNLYYSLWYYSLYRSSIELRMQRHRSRRTASRTAEDLFGGVLREARKGRGFSQEDLAFKSGYHPTYIGQVERGQKSPSLRAILRFAAALETPGSELLKRVELLAVTGR
jgi:DNA-binding XRE family transcriptional regulator